MPQAIDWIQMSRATVEKTGNRYLLSILLLLAALLAVLASLDEHLVRLLIAEDGVIESASALGYVVCIAVIVLFGGWRTALIRVPYITFILLFLALREFDADKRFTTMGIFKSEFYLSPGVPWGEKALAVLFVGLLIWSFIELADRHGRRFLSGLRRFDSVAVCVALAVLLAGIAKTLDGAWRKLDLLGLDLGERGYLLAGSAEEILELGIPVTLTLAAIVHFSADKPGGARHDGS